MLYSTRRHIFIYSCSVLLTTVHIIKSELRDLIYAACIPCKGITVPLSWTMNTLYYTVIVKKYSINLLNVLVFPLHVLKWPNLTLEFSHKVSVRIQYSLLDVINTLCFSSFLCHSEHSPDTKCSQICLTPAQVCWILYCSVYVFLSAQLCLSDRPSRDTQSSTSPSVFCTSVANRHSKGRKFKPWLVPSLPMWLLFSTAFGYFQNDNRKQLIAVLELKIVAFPADSKL